MAFISETIPKWIYKRDHNGSLAGYAVQKFNKIPVQLLAKHGLNLNVPPISDMPINDMPQYC